MKTFKNIIKFTIFWVFLISITSCENYVTGFEIGEQPKKLVLNGIITPDSIIVHLSNSIGVNELLNIQNWVLIDNATIILFEDNVKVGNLEFVEMIISDTYYVKSGYYTLKNFKPKINVTYRLEAESQGFPKISAETVIPVIPQSITVETLFRFQKDEFGNGWIFEFNPVISNNNGKTNNYGFYANLIQDGFVNNIYFYTSSGNRIDFIRYDGWFTTPEILDNSDVESNYFFASDKGFSSDPFSLKFYTDGHRFLDETIESFELVIVFYDSDLYAHLHTIARRYSSREVDFFEEKVSVFSNVKNGLGIFGAKNTYKCEIDFKN